MIQSIFALSLLFAVYADAQTGALGGKFVSQGLSRPLGGFAPADPPPSSLSNYGYSYGYSWAYPIYVPVAQPEPRRRSLPQPPPVQHITVNMPALPAAAPATKAAVNALPPEPPLTNYLLVAYKDHRVYTVDSYWLEGETLHYVTTEKLHNQAAVSLIDFAFMDRLNRR